MEKREAPLSPSGEVREYASRTTRNLLIGGLVIVVVGGTILIAAIYGPQSAGIAVICFAAFALPVGAVLIVLALFQWLTHKYHDKG